MIKINLVPQEILDKEKQKRYVFLASICAGFVVVLFLGLSFFHFYKGVRLQKHLKEQQVKLKSLEAIVRQVEELERKAAAVRARLNVITDLLKSRPLQPNFMEDLLKTFPSGVWLKSLQTSNKGKGLDVNMGAVSLSSEDIAEWLRVLESSERFHKPALGSINVSVAEGTSAFSMKVSYTPRGGKA